MGKRFRTLILLVVLSGVAILVGSSLAQWWEGPPGAPSPSAVPGAPGRVRVEVLNGGGVEGVAWEATRVLRDGGFDVVSYGNVGTYSQDSSVVKDRVGDLETARLVADALGIEDVRSEPDSTLYVDVTVRLGPEWVMGEVGEEGEDEEELPWWSFRRLFGRKDSPGSKSPTGS